jgi:predicted metalloprotease
MRWQGRRQSSNIEDRRGQGRFPGGLGGGLGPRIRLPGGGGGMRVGGGGSIVVIIIFLIIAWFAGINPLDLLSGGVGPSSLSPTTSQQPGEVGIPDDQAGRFVAAVLGDTEDTWTAIFDASGERYEVPTLVLFSGGTDSACGFAQTATGPFYCPGDRKVYIDLAFYSQLRTQLGAPGDMAEAYVIAHEIGHHVQNLLGTLGEFHSARQSMGEAEANQMSVRVELQADCFAGVWASSANSRGILEVGDIDEALNAAAAVGDDTLQRRSQGYVVPESFNHGTSEQRSRWFTRGFETGDPGSCDTFGPSQV